MVTLFGLLDRYVYPSLRRALALELHRMGLDEKAIAEKLGVSRSLVSRYLLGSRGAFIGELSNRQAERIRRLAEEVVRGNLSGREVEASLALIAVDMARSGELCPLHARLDYRFADRSCSMCRVVFTQA